MSKNHDDSFDSLISGLNFMKNLNDQKKICDVCGADFTPLYENHYVSRDCRVASGIIQEPEEYDTYDCVECGSQIVVGVRKIAKTYKEV